MLASVVALAGCGSLARQTMRAASASPLALAPTEQRIRDALISARWDAALRTVTSEKRGGPGDRLLRDLYAGTTAFYAGKDDESAAAFERAATLADDRYTKSVSRGALSLATSDLALPYLPGQNERMMVHYYALLSRLRAGSLEGATVEARRLAFLLQRYDDERTSHDLMTRAMLRLVTGAVFQAAGESNDAAVALRHARALAGGDPLGIVPPDTLAAAGADSGDVLVVVEQGFVAHRVEQRLTVGGDDDWRGYADGNRASPGDAIARAASLLTGDVGLWADAPSAELATAAEEVDEPMEVVAPDGSPVVVPQRAPVTPLATAVTTTPARVRRTSRGGRTWVAWPAYRRPASLPHAALVRDSAVAVPLLRADLSAAEAGDFRRDRAARLARLLVRAALREGAAEGLEKKHREIASIVRAVGSAMERADTRSWHLLPGAVSVARLRLPVGEHTLSVDVGGARVSLGAVQVRAGGLALATTRLWGGAIASAPTLSSAAR